MENKLTNEETKTTGIAVFCKCDKIIYAVTDDGYGKNEKKEVDKYWNEGYRVSRVTKSQVQELFGCSCK